MRERRTNKRRSGGAAASMGVLWARVTQRPIDSFAFFAAAAATLVIVVNAVFLQAGARPAPFVAAPAPTEGPSKPTGTLKSADLAPPRAVAAPAPQQAATIPIPVPAPRRDDPIADLIGPSPRVKAVQRTLSEYGYGQVKPTGLVDKPTSEAISSFERDHKLPVTGRISDKLVGALSAMAGHPI